MGNLEEHIVCLQNNPLNIKKRFLKQCKKIIFGVGGNFQIFIKNGEKHALLHINKKEKSHEHNIFLRV